MQVTQYTQQQLANFKADFAARRRRQLLATAPAVAGVVALAVLGEGAGTALLGLPPTIWQPLGAVAILGVVGFSLRNWRCPACNRYLGRSFNPRFCSKCGVALRD